MQDSLPPRMDGQLPAGIKPTRGQTLSGLVMLFAVVALFAMALHVVLPWAFTRDARALFGVTPWYLWLALSACNLLMLWGLIGVWRLKRVGLYLFGASSLVCAALYALNLDAILALFWLLGPLLIFTSAYRRIGEA